MAQFDFYGTEIDSVGWFRQLSLLGQFRLLRADPTREPVLHEMGDDASSVQAVLTEHVELLLWSDRYSVRPIDFGLPNRLGYYQIRIPRTGPALLLELPRMFERDGVQSIGMGSLYYQPQYQDPLTGNWEGPPPALRQDFSKVKAQLRRGMQTRYCAATHSPVRGFRPFVASVWLGKDAVQKLDAGEAEIRVGAEWVWMRPQDLKLTRGEVRLANDV